jgi:hypothetical protein
MLPKATNTKQAKSIISAPDPEDLSAAEAVPPEPEPRTLFDYALSSLVDRLLCIQSHMVAIESNQDEIRHHQNIIGLHFIAVKTLLEKDLP